MLRRRAATSMPLRIECVSADLWFSGSMGSSGRVRGGLATCGQRLFCVSITRFTTRRPPLAWAGRLLVVHSPVTRSAPPKGQPMTGPREPKSALELLGRPPAPTTGRDRLIAAGLELFCRQGFQAVGLDNVIERAGVTKTTFYKHFEAKDDLVL